jgi:hypothetical protein
MAFWLWNSGFFQGHFLMTTPYQAAFWAHQLSLQQAHDNVESLSRSIANARVDLNPHQVDAALFAFRSPLSKGVILADEVGLGIEAGIVLLQKWAERNGRFYDEETDKLERWGEDLKKGLKAEIEELDAQIAEMNRTARKTPSLTDKLALQKQLRELEQTRKLKRQKIYDEEDAVVARRDAMIARVQEQLKARETITPLFTVQWELEK